MDKVIASLTTIPGREEALKDVIASLLPQVDKLNIYLHGYRDGLPEWLQHEKIEVAFDLEWGDKGDLDKFSWCDEVENCYHLICDDDLIYPSDYVEKITKKIDEYKCIVSYHGAVPFNPPIASYYQDRYVYPCLGTVPMDVEVPVIGTGVMGYHTNYTSLKDFQYKELMANMADVHIAVWAAENKIKLMVLEHQEGWIKHSPYVKPEETIFAKTFHDDFYPTEKINDNAQYFRTRVTGPGPLVSIICIQTRLRTNRDWVREAYASFRNQDYPNIEVIVIDNSHKLITIGKAYNEGIKSAHGEYCLFVGDDDVITDDYVGSLLGYLQKINNDPKVVGVSSYLTMFRIDENGKMKSEPRALIPTGMWNRNWLLENPFCEYLTKYVDTELMERAKEMGFLYPPVTWHYGYYYRSHEKQISGYKQMNIPGEIASHRTDDIKQEIKKVTN